MSAAYTHKFSVQVSDFKDICLLIQLARLVCDFCSSDQRFACGFLQIPPHDGHPCRPANGSPCRVHRRLSLPSECALPGAHKKRPEAFLRAPSNCSRFVSLLNIYPRKPRNFDVFASYPGKTDCNLDAPRCFDAISLKTARKSVVSARSRPSYS